MDMQNVSNLVIPEGTVRTIHNSGGQLLWSKKSYNISYDGDTVQDGTPTPDNPVDIQVVTGPQIIAITDGTNTHNFTVDLGSIELVKINAYRDLIYPSGNDWYIHKKINKVVLNGTENWSAPAAGTGYYEFSGYSCLSPTSPNSYTFPLSNYFYNLTSNRTVAYGSNIFIRVPTETNITTTEEFKSWLNLHTPKIYYQLSTPTDTKITDVTLINQLNAVHQWLTRYGYNANVSGNLPLIVDRTNL